MNSSLKVAIWIIGIGQILIAIVLLFFSPIGIYLCQSGTRILISMSPGAPLPHCITQGLLGITVAVTVILLAVFSIRDLATRNVRRSITLMAVAFAIFVPLVFYLVFA